jgi:hypothetical protein
MKVRLHSAGAASRLAALLLAQILPGILTRRALPSGRIATLGATPDFRHGLLGATDGSRRGPSIDVASGLEAQGLVPENLSYPMLVVVARLNGSSQEDASCELRS